MTEQNGETGKKKLNGDMLSLLVVAGIVLVLIGTAFFISRPNEGKNEQGNVIANQSMGVAGEKTDDETNKSKNIKSEDEKIDDTGNEAEVEEKEAVIKTLETYYYENLLSKIEYDEFGNAIRSCYTDWTVTPHTDITDWEYSREGMAVEKHSTSYDKENNMISEENTVFEYSQEGLLIKEYSEFCDEEGNIEFQTILYEYGEERREGKPIEYNWYRYNSNEIMVEARYYRWNEADKEYKIISKIYGKNIEDLYQYNEYGDVVTISTSLPDGEMGIRKYEYISYDENGEVTRAQWLDDDDNDGIDDNGHVTEIYYEYEYDMNDNMIALYQYQKDGTLWYSYFYTYYE